MFHVTSRVAFSASIDLVVGGDTSRRTHHYLLEARVEGPQVDDEGFLFDITKLNTILNELKVRWGEHVLNDLADFRGLNPTLEQVARVACHEIAQPLVGLPLTSIEVTLFEHEKEPAPGPSAGYLMRLHGDRA
ncbi:6-carboxytetrahydropterin synthase [bacterium]|nr:6-carboxytetrahydropterin synthase [bacterium]